jgi:hypothetical protein
MQISGVGAETIDANYVCSPRAIDAQDTARPFLNTMWAADFIKLQPQHEFCGISSLLPAAI